MFFTDWPFWTDPKAWFTMLAKCCTKLHLQHAANVPRFNLTKSICKRPFIWFLLTQSHLHITLCFHAYSYSANDFFPDKHTD